MVFQWERSIIISWICQLIIGCCLLTSCQSSPPKYPSIEISRVIGGQLVEWIDKSQQPPVIQQGRLAGIEAPDRYQEPWGDQAKQRLIESIKKSSKDPLTV